MGRPFYLAIQNPTITAAMTMAKNRRLRRRVSRGGRGSVKTSSFGSKVDWIESKRSFKSAEKMVRLE